MHSQVAAFLEERAEALDRKEQESAAELDELRLQMCELRAETNAALTTMATELREARSAQARLAQLAAAVLARHHSLLSERDEAAELHPQAVPTPPQLLPPPTARAQF